MDFKEVALKRRSINFFDENKDVPEPLLKEVVELAAKAPSSFNLQPWNIMVLRGMDEKSRLRKLAWDQPKVTEAPVVLIVLADKDGWKDGHKTESKNWNEMIKSGSMVEEKRDWFTTATKSLYGWSSDATLAFAAKNTGFFAMALMYAAKNLGLETHPMDGFDHEGVRKEFNIPDNYWVPLLLSVGYMKPGVELHGPKWRKTYDEIAVKF
jgi:nitroreductase